MTSQRSWRTWFEVIFGFVTLALIAILIFLLPPDFRIFPRLRILVLVLAIVSGALFTIVASRRTTDEVAREAHRVAALWASIFGFVFGCVGLGVIAAVFIPHHLASAENIIFMVGGAGIVCLAWMVGYFILWAVWWLRHR
ncbi:MAG: hypothetical protein WAW96_00655 [Alphaproteobacteria bacterium]